MILLCLNEYFCMYIGSRRKNIRLKGYDYSSYGYYFVTICTKNREECFGEIKNGIMRLNELGCVVAQCLQNIPLHFPHVKLDEWIVTPNHVHGVIINNNWQPNKFGPQSKNLASIIRGFKIGVKKHATINNINFTWQARFYDHIIRNDKSLNKIRKYIQNNPEKWEQDRNNSKNLFM